MRVVATDPASVAMIATLRLRAEPIAWLELLKQRPCKLTSPGTGGIAMPAPCPTPAT